jgi:AcrR family transcriptional regulator
MPDDVRDRQAGVAVVRRAPFSDNPVVGARGLRTQQRILDAALRAFDEQGYHACTVDRIARLTPCSRVAFYQYFSGKEDVFRQLAGQVAREVSASTEALDVISSGPEGWDSLRSWVGRHAEVYERYESVFHAVETDAELSAIAGRTGEETVQRIRSRLQRTTLPRRHQDPTIRLLLDALNHAFGVVGILRAAAHDAYPGDRVETAATDLLHRTLFGLIADVNVHEPNGPQPPAIRFDAAAVERLRSRDNTLDNGSAGNRAHDALLASARQVFVERGYHNTRVDDLVAAAGVSHGAFYRYFTGKDELARILNARALRDIGTELAEIPDPATLDGAGGDTALRRWLRRLHDAQADQAAMLRVWVEAALQDPILRVESAPPLDWGRRRMARYLRPRAFGDPDMDAVLMVALFGVFGARARTALEVEAAAHVVERGLLGH